MHATDVNPLFYSALLLSALPVPLLRQVFLNKGLTRKIMTSHLFFNKEIILLVKPLLSKAGVQLGQPCS